MLSLLIKNRNHLLLLAIIVFSFNAITNNVKIEREKYNQAKQLNEETLVVENENNNQLLLTIK